jgi:uncharacterized membrane protein YhiD involved in acid resistance
MIILEELNHFLLAGSGQVLLKVVTAFLCGFFVSLLYRWTHKGPNYSATFVRSLVALSMITTIVIAVIGNNLARAFGLVGALSIIRFRTAIKDMHDIVFIFFALAIGMATGVGMHITAIMGMTFTGIVLLVLSRMNYASPTKCDFVLQFSFTAHDDQDPPYMPILEKHCKKHELVNLQSLGRENGSSNGAGQAMGLSFYIDLHSRGSVGKLVRDLGRVQGVEHINLFFDEEPF